VRILNLKKEETGTDKLERPVEIDNILVVLSATLVYAAKVFDC